MAVTSTYRRAGPVQRFWSVIKDICSRPSGAIGLALVFAHIALALIGPFIDKVRGGHRIVLATTLTDENALIHHMKSHERRIVIIDDAGRIGLRAPGGNEVVRSFLRIVLATQDSVLWVIGIRLPVP